MPRENRVTSKTGIYHIVIRGINQQRIFNQAKDFQQFLDFLYDVKKQSGFTLFAYCLMGNRAHLLLKEGAEPLSQIFKRLGTRYAQWFNRKYKRSGHLFHDRYLSEAVEDAEYFMAVLLYIYQNPVKAGIYRSTTEYEWCSRMFLGKGDGLVDETELIRIAPVSAIKKREHILVEESMIDKTGAVRRTGFSDEEAAKMLRLICGAQSAPDFQGLPRDIQMATVAKLRTDGVSIRQAARLTGLGKGTIEYWSKVSR